MSDTVVVGILSLAGTLTGSVVGIIASSSLTRYRIKQLEQKVGKHNTLIERMYKIEGRVDTLEQLKKGGIT
jgi:Cys-tRNA synthase (O-phospho-L-seryl-tRNA:Cys-tRNA synthase)